VKIMCLSSGKGLRNQLHGTAANIGCATGDADGLGETRKKELIKSGLQLGVGSKDDILIIEDK
jgi:N-acetylglucosaminylphosphatidylinositol deacetylase